MCDCYNEPCKICGKLIPLHLGDFNTPRLAIAVICDRCRKEWNNNIPPSWFGEKSYCVWKDKKLGRILIFSLTSRAWKNREINSPNTGEYKLILEYPIK